MMPRDKKQFPTEALSCLVAKSRELLSEVLHTYLPAPIGSASSGLGKKSNLLTINDPLRKGLRQIFNQGAVIEVILCKIR